MKKMRAVSITSVIASCTVFCCAFGSVAFAQRLGGSVVYTPPPFGSFFFTYLMKFFPLIVSLALMAWGLWIYFKRPNNTSKIHDKLDTPVKKSLRRKAILLVALCSILTGATLCGYYVWWLLKPLPAPLVYLGSNKK